MFLHVIVRSSPCCECLSVSEVYSAIQWIIKVFYFERRKTTTLSFHQDITGAYFFRHYLLGKLSGLEKKGTKQNCYHFDSLVLQ